MAKIKLTKDFTGQFKISLDQLQEMDRQHNALKGIRGNVIEITIDIEKQLNYLISYTLFGGAKNRQSDVPHETKGEIRFFEEFILNSTFLTLGSKLKIFRALYRKCSFFKDYEQTCEDLATNLKKVMEWRDRFAHGEITFKTTKDGFSDKPFLFYYFDNELKEQILDNKFFDEVMNPLFNEAYNQITDLRGNIDKLFEKDKPKFDVI